MDSLHVVVALESDQDGDQPLRRLRAELAELDVDAVAFRPGDLSAPEGAKGVDPAAIGQILVTLSAAGSALAGLVGTVDDWLHRQHGKQRVTLSIGGDTLELDAATADQQEQLITAFLRRHGEP